MAIQVQGHTFLYLFSLKITLVEGTNLREVLDLGLDRGRRAGASWLLSPRCSQAVHLAAALNVAKKYTL